MWCLLIKLYQGNSCGSLVTHLWRRVISTKYGEGQGGCSTKVCRRAHGCGHWRSIHEGWESFSKHLSFAVGDGTRIRFWHDRWIGDNSLKFLYPELYECLADKEACISEVLWLLEGGIVRVWDLRFYREFQDWELAESYSLLEFIQPRIRQDVGSDTFCWCLKGDGKFDTQTFYNVIQDAQNSMFPWKGVWKTKVPKRADFFLWTTARDQILSLDNLMLRGHSLANQCCMCRCDGESMDHLLLHYLVTHTLWILMLQAFSIHWVMPGSMAGFLFCLHQWLGNHTSNIWNLIPS